MPLYNSNENALMHSLEEVYREMRGAAASPPSRRLISEMDYQAPTQVPQPRTGQQVRTAPQPETRRAPTATQRAQQNMQQMKSQKGQAPPVASTTNPSNDFASQYFAKGLGDPATEVAGPAGYNKYGAYGHQQFKNHHNLDLEGAFGAWSGSYNAALDSMIPTEKAYNSGNYSDAAKHMKNSIDAFNTNVDVENHHWPFKGMDKQQRDRMQKEMRSARQNTAKWRDRIQSKSGINLPPMNVRGGGIPGPASAPMPTSQSANPTHNGGDFNAADFNKGVDDIKAAMNDMLAPMGGLEGMAQHSATQNRQELRHSDGSYRTQDGFGNIKIHRSYEDMRRHQQMNPNHRSLSPNLNPSLSGGY